LGHLYYLSNLKKSVPGAFSGRRAKGAAFARLTFAALSLAHPEPIISGPVSMEKNHLVHIRIPLN
jgi:hypothetical protein